jgi:hypothetical protein
MKVLLYTVFKELATELKRTAWMAFRERARRVVERAKRRTTARFVPSKLNSAASRAKLSRLRPYDRDDR